MSSHSELTEREREVAALVALGVQNKRIARQLGISPKTVECHRAAIRAKLGGTTTAGIVAWAIRSGLIPA